MKFFAVVFDWMYDGFREYARCFWSCHDLLSDGQPAADGRAAPPRRETPPGAPARHDKNRAA